MPQPIPVTSHHTQLTLDVLPLLAQVRPEIQSLGIHIHPTSPTLPTSGDLGPLPLVLENLKYLVLGTDTMVYDPDDLAFFLAEATPPTCEMDIPDYFIYFPVLGSVMRRLNALVKMVLTIRKAGAHYDKRIAQLGKRIEELEEKVEELQNKNRRWERD